MSEEPKFNPTWLYGPDGQSVCCRSEEQHDELSDKGYKDSPAAFDAEDPEDSLGVTMDNTRQEILEFAAANGVIVDQSLTKAQLLEALEAATE